MPILKAQPATYTTPLIAPPSPLTNAASMNREPSSAGVNAWRYVVPSCHKEYSQLPPCPQLNFARPTIKMD